MSPIHTGDRPLASGAEAAQVVCEVCHEVVDPDDQSAVQAFVQVDLSGSGNYNDTIDGRPVCFHERCFPHGERRYRQSS